MFHCIAGSWWAKPLADNTADNSARQLTIALVVIIEVTEMTVHGAENSP